MIKVNKLNEKYEKLKLKKNKHLKYESFIWLDFGEVAIVTRACISFAATVMKTNFCVCLNVCQGHRE